MNGYYDNRMSTNTFGERLRQLRESRGLGVRELGRRSGVNHATISLAERNQRWVDQLPSIEVMEQLAQALEVTVEELRGTKQPVSQVAEPRAAYDSETTALAEIGRQVMRLVQEQQNVRPQGWRSGGGGSRRFPIINTVPASDATVRDSQLEEEIDIPDAFWLGAGDPQVYRVTGDCMTGARIFSGNTIIIDAARTEPREGQIVVAQVNGGLTLKRFYRTASGVELRPDAPGYESIFVKRSEELVICGVLHKVYDGGER